MRRIAVHVDAPVEHGRGILADAGADHGFAARMSFDKVRDVVDDARDGDEAAAVLGLVDVVVPLHDREGVEGNAPIELGALLVEFLLELLHAALFDFVLLELLEVVGEAELLPDPDGPLGGIVLVPFDGVAVVGGEFVVEVVVAFAEGDERGDDVVTGGVAVVKGLVAEPVGKRIHAEGCLLHEEDAEDAAVDDAAEPVTPEEAADDHGEDEAHEEDYFEVVSVLPYDDGVFVEVGDVGSADPLRVLLHQHPAKVGVEETFADGVGVFVGVGVAVVSSVVSSPPSNRSFDGSSSNGG